jgi:hypothetical protein
MPKKINGKPVDEKLWSAAEREVAKEYNKETEPGKYYGTLQKIYNNMIKSRKK